MNNDDLIQLILSGERSCFCIVGKNATGKSYFLNNVFHKLDKPAMFFDEEKNIITNIAMARVRIESGLYIYDDSAIRGTSKSVEVETSLISFDVLNFIEKLKGWKKLLDVRYKSTGSIKLLNIINGLLSHNLDNLFYFLFDEPETSLDDENIKILVSIFQNLIYLNKEVIFVSHSPRFLELLKINIDDIYIFSNLFGEIKNVTTKKVREIYDQTCDEIIPIFKPYQPNFNKDTIIYKKDSLLVQMIIEDFLSSVYFYRSLFYKEIFLIEGESEEYLVRRIYSEEFVTYNFYATHGKYFMPFFIKLFSLIVDKIYCFFDTDIKNGDENLAKCLTSYLNTMSSDKIKLIGVESNIEDFLGIDLDKIVVEMVNQKVSSSFRDNFSRVYKSLICSYKVKTDEESKKKIIELFKQKTATEIFKEWI